LEKLRDLLKKEQHVQSLNMLSNQFNKGKNQNPNPEVHLSKSYVFPQGFFPK